MPKTKNSRRRSSRGDIRRQTYVLTYSQADLSVVPTREFFAEIWVKAFGESAVKQWLVCKEYHKDGNPHYHMAIKLHNRTRFSEIKKSFESKYPTVKCHFLEIYTCYEDAFIYLTKSDKNYVTSEGHPYLINRPRTAAATASRMSQSVIDEVSENSESEGEESETLEIPRRQRVKLDEISLYEIITTQNIKDEDDLFLQARLQYDEGKVDLLKYVMRLQTGAKRRELIRSAWKTNNSLKEAKRKKMDRMDILREAREKECVCQDQYRLAAVEVLERNEINIESFKSAVLKAIQYGRDKHNNVLLHGKSDSGKTFLLKPLVKIFKTFESPATGTFAWVGAEKAECVFLNDLRWSEKLIAWPDFLNLLEGAAQRIPAPKTHYSEDIVWEYKSPIFATSDEKIVAYDGKKIDKDNTKMMDNRWVYFEFTRPLTVTRKIAPCGRCFARFILS